VFYYLGFGSLYSFVWQTFKASVLRSFKQLFFQQYIDSTFEYEIIANEPSGQHTDNSTISPLSTMGTMRSLRGSIRVESCGAPGGKAHAPGGRSPEFASDSMIDVVTALTNMTNARSVCVPAWVFGHQCGVWIMNGIIRWQIKMK
jgi:hypothetical protein